jgi:hypothetical protein
VRGKWAASIENILFSVFIRSPFTVQSQAGHALCCMDFWWGVFGSLIRIHVCIYVRD